MHTDTHTRTGCSGRSHLHSSRERLLVRRLASVQRHLVLLVPRVVVAQGGKQGQLALHGRPVPVATALTRRAAGYSEVDGLGPGCVALLARARLGLLALRAVWQGLASWPRAGALPAPIACCGRRQVRRSLGHRIDVRGRRQRQRSISAVVLVPSPCVRLPLLLVVPPLCKGIEADEARALRIHRGRDGAGEQAAALLVHAVRAHQRVHVAAKRLDHRQQRRAREGARAVTRCKPLQDLVHRCWVVHLSATGPGARLVVQPLRWPRRLGHVGRGHRVRCHRRLSTGWRWGAPPVVALQAPLLGLCAIPLALSAVLVPCVEARVLGALGGLEAGRYPLGTVSAARPALTRPTIPSTGHPQAQYGGPAGHRTARAAWRCS